MSTSFPVAYPQPLISSPPPPSRPVPIRPGACHQFGNSVISSVTLTKKLICDDTYCAGKVAKLVEKTVAFTALFFKETLPACWTALRTSLKGFAEVTEVFDAIKRIDAFFSGKATRWAEKISLIFFTIFRIIGVANFLDKIRLTNFQQFAKTLGRIPIIGRIFLIPASLFGLVSSTFDLAEQGLKLKDYHIEGKVNKIVLAQWKMKKEIWTKLKSNTTITPTDWTTYEHHFARNGTQIEALRLKANANTEVRKNSYYDYTAAINLMMTPAGRAVVVAHAVTAEWNAFRQTVTSPLPATSYAGTAAQAVGTVLGAGSPLNLNDVQCITQKLDFEEKKWTKLTANVGINQTTALLNAIGCVGKIVIAVSGFFLAPALPFMVALGLIVAVLSLIPSIYTKKYDKDYMALPKMPDIVIAGHLGTSTGAGIADRV